LDEELGKELRRACRQNVFFIGPLHRNLLLDAMYASDFVVNCSISEGMSNTILEAMTLGHPLVIARNNEGNRSLVVHKKNGLLFETAKEFAQLVKWVLSDSKAKQNMIKEGQTTFSELVKDSQEDIIYDKLLKTCLAETPV
jgi:glycosyltransferase involved in cell wall biosynthesis